MRFGAIPAWRISAAMSRIPGRADGRSRRPSMRTCRPPCWPRRCSLASARASNRRSPTRCRPLSGWGSAGTSSRRPDFRSARRQASRMHYQSLKFFRDLLETPSASGFEQAIQDVVRAWASRYADEVRTDRHGNVIAALYPRDRVADDAQRVMLAGHCDQIALMVQHIDDNGYLYVQPLGGWVMQLLLGQHLTVWTRAGPVTGVVSRKATHLLTPEERAKVPQFTDIWVDIGAKDRAEAQKVVRHGDSITFA